MKEQIKQWILKKLLSPDELWAVENCNGRFLSEVRRLRDFLYPGSRDIGAAMACFMKQSYGGKRVSFGWEDDPAGSPSLNFYNGGTPLLKMLRQGGPCISNTMNEPLKYEEEEAK